MQSYIKTVRKEISKHSKNKSESKVKIPFDNYKSEDVFTAINGKNSKPERAPRKKISKNKYSLDLYKSEEAFVNNDIKQNGSNKSHNVQKSKKKYLLSPSISENDSISSPKLKLTKKRKLQKINSINFSSESANELKPKKLKKKAYESPFQTNKNESIDSDYGIKYMYDDEWNSEQEDFSFEEFSHNYSVSEDNYDISPEDTFKDYIESSSNFGKVKGLSSSSGLLDCSDKSLSEQESVDESGPEKPLTEQESVDECGSEKSLTEPESAEESEPENLPDTNDDASEMRDQSLELPSNVFPDSVQSFDLHNATLLIIKKEQYLNVHGYGKVEVIYGSIKVFGNVLGVNKIINLFSPRGTALYSLENASESDNFTVMSLQTLVPILQKYSNLDDITIHKNDAVVLITKIDSPKVTFIEEHISQQIFPTVAPGTPQVSFNPIGNWNSIKISPIWDEKLEKINTTSKCMLIGGKGVGKSTLLRYAINKLLMSYKEIRIIDLDPGQSEFTVPSCVSIVKIDKPIYGPNYFHLTSTERSILSNINVGNNPSKYIEAVESLMTFYNTLSPLPTLINSMGFTTGIGINIVSSIIAAVQPTSVVQIVSRNRKKNFPCVLTVDNVLGNLELFYRQNLPHLSYQLDTVPSMTDINDGWSLEPRQLREMCILSYFGQLVKDGNKPITSSDVLKYQRPLSSLQIVDSQGKTCPPSSANANLVALCDMEESKFICYGWGIVQGIDPLKDNLVLITPEPVSVLEKVDYLVVGCINLPPTMYMNIKGVSGLIPYVMNGELEALSQFTKRVYKPPNNR